MANQLTARNVRSWAYAYLDLDRKIASIKSFRTYFAQEADGLAQRVVGLKEANDMVELFIEYGAIDDTPNYRINDILDVIRARMNMPASTVAPVATLGDILNTALKAREDTYTFEHNGRVTLIRGRDAAKVLNDQLIALGVTFNVYQPAKFD